MENEERIPVKAQKAWQTPEIIDLDVDKTAKSWYFTEVDSIGWGPS